jgi:hypothetical protein
LRGDRGLDIPSPGQSAFDIDPRSAFESVFLTAVLGALGEDHLTQRGERPSPVACRSRPL